MDESTSSQASSKLENFYTPLEEVVAELQKRRADTGLLQQVHSHLQDAIPEAFFSGPKAVLFRNIISPNTEFIRFLSQAEKLGYPPLGMEHTRDKFSTRNRDKMALAKLPLILGESKNGDLIVHKKKIIDIKESDNKPFREILTIGNESLPHFHRCLLRNYMGEEHEITDLSDWLLTHGESAEEYYEKFLTLFIYHGVLFETFITTGPESAFTNSVVIPAFEAITKKFGVKPLIVKSIDDNDDHDFWTYYPSRVHNP